MEDDCCNSRGVSREHTNLNTICYIAFSSLCMCWLLSAFSVSNFNHTESVSIMHQTTASFSVRKETPHNAVAFCRLPLQGYSAISLWCDLLGGRKSGIKSSNRIGGMRTGRQWAAPVGKSATSSLCVIPPRRHGDTLHCETARVISHNRVHFEAQASIKTWPQHHPRRCPLGEPRWIYVRFAYVSGHPGVILLFHTLDVIRASPRLCLR